MLLPRAEFARHYYIKTLKQQEVVDSSRCSIKQTIVKDSGLIDSGVYTNGTFLSVHVHSIQLAPHILKYIDICGAKAGLQYFKTAGGIESGPIPLKAGPILSTHYE